MTDTIIEGAEPIFLPGNDIGVLLVHGFTGTTQSMRYLGHALNKAGFTVVAPRLEGHGVSAQAMAKSTATQWVRSAEDGMDQIRAKCRSVFVAGLSMGGTLSLYLAATYPTAFKGVVPINAAIQTDSTDLAGLAFGKGLPDFIPGIGSDVKDPESKELAYPEVPVASVKEVLGLTAATRTLLPRIVCATLIIQSREDHVVPPANVNVIAAGVSSDQIEILRLNNSYHVATIDHDKALIASEIIGFIRRHA
jgi:carboxylesterase